MRACQVIPKGLGMDLAHIGGLPEVRAEWASPGVLC